MWPEHEILSLVAYIYDAALDPSLWSQFLDRLCETLGGASGLILQFDCARKQQYILATSQIDPAYERSYVQYYWRRNVWTAGVERPVPDRARLGEAACPSSKLVRTEFYQDFLRPQDVMYSVAACIKFDQVSAPFCSFFRSARAGPFEECHARLLTILTPHLRRALQLQDRTEMFRVQSAAALAALDTITMGCMLVDQSARVLLANQAAEQYLNEADGLSLDRGVLCATGAGVQQRFRQLIHCAGATINGRGLSAGGALAIERPSGRAPLQVLVIPFRGTGWPGAAAAAMVFITGPEHELRPDAEVLGAVFGLSPAESRVAVALLNGKSIDQCADELAISRHTARNHLKAIFAKTGVTRQGELVRLLLLSVARLKT